MKFLLLLIAPLVLAVSCAPSTPKSRIADHPGRFSRLSDREKDLVEQGRIDRGMSMEGVWLAWGEPSSRYDGSRAGKATERWVYSSAEPVYTSTFVTGFGWGGSSRYGYRGYDVGIAPRIDYVPEDRASVLFVNHRVESWERKH